MKPQRVYYPTGGSSDLLDKHAPHFRRVRMHRTTGKSRRWRVRSPCVRAAVVILAERVRG
jgi:hypothetical protein